MAFNYNSMTVAQLKTYAKEKGIRLSQYDKTKADIIQTITKRELNNTQGDYEKKTVAELKAFADENRIKIPSRAKKADIIATILEAESGVVEPSKKLTEDSLITILQTKPGRTILENNRKYNRYGGYTICPRCGEEIYASGDMSTDVKDQLKKCPKCKGKLELVKGRYTQEDIGEYACISDTVFKKLKKKNDEINRESLREKANQYIEKVQNKDTKTNSVNKRLSLEELKQYILYLIHIESEIYYLNERLVEVQMKDLDNDQGYVRAQMIVNNEVDKDFNLINKKTANEILDLKHIISHPESVMDENGIVVKIDQVEPLEPVKPTAVKPEVPQEPTYKKPRLFNKKKVTAKNEALRKEYESEKEKYEEALLVYENEQEAYLNRLNEFKNENKKYKSAYKKASSDALKKEKKRIINENEALLKEKENEAKELNTKMKERISEYLDLAPQHRVSALLTFEEKEIKQELKKIISARDELYSYDIIYGKYRNYVALTTLYEYLDSGRCITLEGPEGAYNLFELESRTNEVVVQLKTLVTSLESLKENQFMLYEEMKKVNNNLNIINESLDKAVEGIEYLQWTERETNAHLAEIENTAKGILVTSAATAHYSATTAHYSAVTAHYSAITAHYSKVNAELTNALGFMIAMK